MDAKFGAVKSASRWPRGLASCRRHRTSVHAHPDVRELFGADPVTAVWILAFAAAQLALAVPMATARPWVLVSMAVTVGAVWETPIVLVTETVEAVPSLTTRSMVRLMVPPPPVGSPLAGLKL